MATHSSILGREIAGTEELVGFSPWGCKELDTTERLKNSAICLLYAVGESQVPICSGKEFSLFSCPLLLSRPLPSPPCPQQPYKWISFHTGVSFLVTFRPQQTPSCCVMCPGAVDILPRV